MKAIFRRIIAAAVLSAAPAAFAQTVTFGCDFESCWAPAYGATEPVTWIWTSTPGEVTFPYPCPLDDSFCFYICVGGPTTPRGYVHVSVYDGNNVLIGSGSELVCP